MRFTKTRFFGLLAAGSLLTSAAALAQDSSSGTAPATEAAAAPVLETYDANTVLATVDGVDVTLGQLIAARQGLPEQIQGLPDATLFEGLLTQIVDETLLVKKAEAAGLPEDPQVASRLAAARRNILADAFLSSQIEAQLSDAALKERYDAAIAEQPKKEEIRARHILVETEEKAKELITKLNEGADFAELAKEASTGPSGVNGGDLGYFQKGQMVPAFSDAAFALEAGQVSAPVKTDFGWHVIKLEDRRDVQPPAFEAVTEELRSALRQELTQDVLAQTRAGATITEAETLPPASAINDDALLGAQ
ncbi:MAG: peptidylprolyl isomerase [Neomegalonema sp.]|nr:peptidylprolyl isomerase [Neomegalonema sp.]